jgi:hypothetical protein
VVQGVEEDDCGVLAGEGDGGEGGWENGVGYDEVEEGGFACSGGVVGWWRRDEFEIGWG